MHSSSYILRTFNIQLTLLLIHLTRENLYFGLVLLLFPYRVAMILYIIMCQEQYLAEKYGFQQTLYNITIYYYYVILIFGNCRAVIQNVWRWHCVLLRLNYLMLYNNMREHIGTILLFDFRVYCGVWLKLKKKKQIKYIPNL